MKNTSIHDFKSFPGEAWFQRLIIREEGECFEPLRCYQQRRPKWCRWHTSCHFISFHFISFHFISFHFISFHFILSSFHHPLIIISSSFHHHLIIISSSSHHHLIIISLRTGGKPSTWWPPEILVELEKNPTNWKTFIFALFFRRFFKNATCAKTFLCKIGASNQ